MPEFTPQHPEQLNAVSEFTRGYLSAAEFTADDEIGEHRGWTRDTLNAAERVCVEFVNTLPAPALSGYPEFQAGADLWYTRNGHGCGYWENDHGTPEVCETLTRAAKALGECYVFRTRNGYIAIE